MRMIVDGDIESRKIAENSDAIAVLEIKPLAKGHTIIIPKKKASSFKEISPKTHSLAKEAGIKIASKLQTNGFSIEPEIKFGEAILNVVPHHSGKTNSRYDATQKELEEVFEKIMQKDEEVKKVKEVKKEKFLLKRKIP